MKTVYLKSLGNIHSSLLHLINYPPEDYQFLIGTNILNKIGTASILRFFQLRICIERWLPLNFVGALYNTLTKISKSIDLIYAYNHLIFKNLPWVVQVEFAHMLVGTNIKLFNIFKKIIENRLSSKSCKGIIVISEYGKNSLLLNLNCDKFEYKIEVLPPAVPRKSFVKEYDDDKIRLLFVGSVNLPHAFISKGGEEVIRAFFELNKRYKNLELIIRAKVPDNIKLKYKLHKVNNIKLIERELTWDELAHEFTRADIFLYPTREAHNFVILDAMSYELPVVTTEIGSTGRIEDGVTGFIIAKELPLTYAAELLKNGYQIYGYISLHDIIQTERSFKTNQAAKAIRAFVNKTVEELVEKTSILIENPKLRRMMGRRAKYEIEYGKFSIKKRNEKLKELLDRATS